MLIICVSVVSAFGDIQRDDMVLEIKFDNNISLNENSTFIKDTSQSNLSGNVFDSDAISYIINDDGFAMQTNATQTSRIIIADNPETDLTSNFSYSVDIKRTGNVDGYDMVFSKYGTSSSLAKAYFQLG